MTSSIAVTVDTAKWAKQFGTEVKRTTNAMDFTVKKVAERLKKQIEFYTPVGDPSLWNWPAHKDYTPGKLKANWTLTVNGKETTISNDLPYALRVEFGWSTQAPEGMMRRAVLDYPILFNRTAAEYKV
jgi:hypothetical protein